MKTNITIFPTGYKARIPKTLSYVLGAEKISEALGETPQAPLFTISFSSNDSIKHRRGRERPYPVFEVEYHNYRPTRSSSNDMIASGFYEPRWEISVRPVPCELRHTVSELLLGEGFSRVRAWLLARAKVMGHVGCQRISLLFDETTQELRYEQHSHS